MKFEKIETKCLSAVEGQTDVTFSVEKSESKELREALAVVEKYKKAAFAAIKKANIGDPRESNWHMISYLVKSGEVTISLTDGMTG